MREGILTHGGSYGLKCESNSTKPPEARSRDLAFFALSSVYKGLQRFATYNCIVLDTN